MDRRSFGRIALAAGLAAPELARAASGDEHRGVRLPYFGPLVVRLGGTNIYVTEVAIAGPGAGRIALIRSDLPMFDERRFDLGGGIFRPVPRRRFAETSPVGRVVLDGSALVVLPEAAVDPQRMVVLWYERSWDLPRPMPSALPGLGDASAQPTVGEARISAEGELALFLSPVEGV